MRTSLPACERVFLPTLKASTKLSPWCSWNLLSCLFQLMTGAPNTSHKIWFPVPLRRPLMFSFAAEGVDLLKKRVVFSLLIFYPDDDSYIVSNFRILSHSSELALQNNKLSYAKKQMISFGPCLQGEKSVIHRRVSHLYCTLKPIGIKCCA